MVPPEWEALDALRLSGLLRESFPADEAAALGEQLSLRGLARERYGELPLRLYSREGLEMMTHPLVARRRAVRLARLGLPVGDLGCGLGGDARAMVDSGVEVMGVERDAATALLAAVNLDGRVASGDASRPPLNVEAMAVFIDPSRRERGSRRFDPGAFSPPWDVAVEMTRDAKAGVIKAAPGIDHAVLPPEAEVEFVQVGRTLREAAAWLGAGALPGLRRAVLLPVGVELDSAMEEAPGEVGEADAFVVDPESCVTRAGLVRQLAAVVGGRMMDRQVAYLAANELVPHPLAATFEVLARVPFSVSRVRELLRANGWRADEIRRRAFPVEPDELRRLLGRLEGTPVTLICTTLAGGRTVFVGRRVDR